MKANSERLRQILGFHHVSSVEGEPPGKTYLRFEPEDALRIRVASLKSMSMPPCPACTVPLRKEVSAPSDRGACFAIFLCDGCRRSVVIRMSDPPPIREVESTGIV